MMAVDDNIKVYAHRRDSRYRYQAAGTMRSLAEVSQLWTVPWPCC